MNIDLKNENSLSISKTENDSSMLSSETPTSFASNDKFSENCILCRE